MVPTGTSRRWHCISGINGYQWCYLQYPSCSQPSRRYSQCVCASGPRFQCVDSMGYLYVSIPLLIRRFTHELSRKSRFTKEMKDESAGLLAAAFIGIVPGYISRSVAGSYDNEAIAIFLLMFTFYCWIKALKQGSALFGTIAAVFYFYMVAAWGMYSLQLSAKRAFLILNLRWLCFHHKYDPFACSCTCLDGSLL